MSNDLKYGFVPIVKHYKTDDGTLIVEGPATDSIIDRDQQIADPAWLAKAMPAWYSEGGNLREQHDAKRAVGTAVHYEQRDSGQHWIKAEVVDPLAILKVEKKVLRGFSFGARNARVAVDKAASGGRIVDGDIFEVSLVDRPANPNCLFTVAKADGNGDLQVVDEPELIEVDKATGGEVDVIEKADEPRFTPSQFADLLKGLGKTPEPAAPKADDVIEKKDFTQAERDAAAEKGHALPDGSYPIENKDQLGDAIQAYGRAKDKAAAKRHIIKRARALDAVDMLPDDWGVSKADGILADIRALVPGALTKADGDAFNPDTEASDVDNGTSAIAAIARLIISEAEGLAAGRMEEIWDIQTLVNAACALQCFVASETEQEAELAMPDAAKTDTTDVAGTEPVEPAAIEKTEAAPEGELTKTDLTDLLQDAITKATKPLQDELVLVKGELAKVLETPQPGGPARMRTTTHTAVAAKADTLRAEIALCRQSIPTTSGDLQKGYRQRLDNAEAELVKLDGAV